MKRPLRALAAAAAVAVLFALAAAWLARPRANAAHVHESAPAAGCALFTPGSDGADHSMAREASAPTAADQVGDRVARDAMRERIVKTTAARASSNGAGAASKGAETTGASAGAEWYAQPGKLEPSYIQSRIRDLFWPQVRSCFAEARARSPKLAGTLAIKFVIVGDAQIGGIVESADVDAPRTTVHDDALADCVTQSMLTMTFRAPESGGTIAVVYPFVLGEETLDGGHERITDASPPASP